MLPSHNKSLAKPAAKTRWQGSIRLHIQKLFTEPQITNVPQTALQSVQHTTASTLQKVKKVYFCFNPAVKEPISFLWHFKGLGKICCSMKTQRKTGRVRLHAQTESYGNLAANQHLKVDTHTYFLSQWTRKWWSASDRAAICLSRWA